ncbi:MAG: AraC family transcriptional regulator [Rhizomicrobium sp.]
MTDEASALLDFRIVAALVQSGCPDSDEALRAVRIRCDGADREVRWHGVDADCAELYLRNTPALESIRDGRTQTARPRQALESAMEDLRVPVVWRVTHPMDRIDFRIPSAGLRRWAEDAGLRTRPVLQFAPGESLADDTIRNFGLAMLPALESPAEASTLFVDSILHAVCTHLAVAYGGAVPKAVRRGGLAPWQERRAKERISAGLSCGVSLQEIADECGISVAHFSRAFRETTGLAPYQWLQRRRIDSAKALLAVRSIPIHDIATRCGFTDQSHFTRVFSKCAGTTPAAWRRTALGDPAMRHAGEEAVCP